MWEKKTYPLDKSKKKSKGTRKQRHHAVSSNQLLVPDRRGTSSMKAHWSRLDYGSVSCMLRQLMNEFDDDSNDYDNDNDYVMDYADGDVADMGHAEHEVGEVENDSMEGEMYAVHCAYHGSHGYDLMDHADYEKEEAEMMGYVYIEFERDVESEDEWTLIADI
jgi:hypothetical protein